MGKVHRLLGPALIAGGIVNGAIGFHFAGRDVHIIPYVVVIVAVAIAMAAALFFKMRKQRRTQPMNTAAAQNFRTADVPLGQYHGPPPGGR